MKRFEDLCEIVEANGELMGDPGNKGAAVATLSLLFLIHKFPPFPKRILYSVCLKSSDMNTVD